MNGADSEIPPEQAINAKIVWSVLTSKEIEICGDKGSVKHYALCH
jgi:hypothetical protein